jgi:sulfite reductase (ferredoxin)
MWMQRVMIPGGALTSRQWHALARSARELTPHTPLHLTTRQDIELHNLNAQHVPRVQKMIADAGLTCLGAGGDSLRNITVCPCSGLSKGSVNLHPLAAQVLHSLQNEQQAIFALPRKFKISFSCSDACGSPWINDLGFVARRWNNQYGFRLIGAGSLGAKPRTGIVLFDWLPAEEVKAAALAAVRLFAEHGDRKHRSRARLRHVRERLGDRTFITMLASEFDKATSQRSRPNAVAAKPNGRFASRLVLTFPNGDLSPDAADSLAGLAGEDDVRLRISRYHQILLFGTSDRQLREAVAAMPALAGPAASQATVVACPGTRWCKYGLVDTNRISQRIHVECSQKLGPDTVVCVSGCRNGCAHSAVADIGLIGQRVSHDGQKAEAFELFAQGGMGHTGKLALPIASGLSADEVLSRIDELRPLGRGGAEP